MQGQVVTGFNSRTHAGCDVQDPRGPAGCMFQFTHPRGVRCQLQVHKVWVPGFNSRTHAGCDWMSCSSPFASRFQFTHPRGVRCERCDVGLCAGRFNSRTHAGCDGKCRSKAAAWGFQFTHPRGVRLSHKFFATKLAVSIHAPTRGAIMVRVEAFDQFGFNSRTHAGCDSRERRSWSRSLFQFTHPRGVRFLGRSLFQVVQVSIHAPTRGAIQRNGGSGPLHCFNSRTHAGCDSYRNIFATPSRFQFTHPRGVRCAALWNLCQ
ncbi:hypothetical protein SAMN05720764_10841 [Fibrobacter sp. UWH5]|nr:hypothetical protein SAMN05720764_10841 [Fibrobacter sp. UWH5]